MPERGIGLPWKVLLLCVALPATTAAGEPDGLGFILEAVGPWQVAGGGGAATPRPLLAGEAVKAGDRLIAGAPESRVTVVMLDGSRLLCPSDARCAAPLAGPSSSARPGLARRLLKAIGGLFEQPERYAATMSRGEELRESIAVLARDRLDLGDLLSALPRGPVRLTLQPIDAAGRPSSDEKIEIAADTSKAGAAALASARGLTPGLYRASLESGADAWVLVTGSGKAKQQRAQFAEARRIASELGREATARSVRSFLRAALDGIAHGKIQ